jgi:hypothetical protein
LTNAIDGWLHARLSSTIVNTLRPPGQLSA